MKPNPIILALASAVLAFGAASVMARDDHGHDGHGARHGGQFVELEDHHGVEMVVDGARLVFHLTEGDNSLDLAGSSFKVIIQSDAGTKMLPLTIDSGALVAKLDATPPAGAKIAISGKDAGGHAIQARFVKK